MSVEGEPLRQSGAAVGVGVGVGVEVCAGGVPGVEMGVSCPTVAVVLALAVAGVFPVTAVEGFCWTPSRILCTGGQ